MNEAWSIGMPSHHLLVNRTKVRRFFAHTCNYSDYFTTDVANLRHVKSFIKFGAKQFEKAMKG